MKESQHEAALTEFDEQLSQKDRKDVMVFKFFDYSMQTPYRSS
jgi:hypothetical protein